ncbi:hypothetical protein ACFX2J_032213 [Malus domestica]
MQASYDENDIHLQPSWELGKHRTNGHLNHIDNTCPHPWFQVFYLYSGSSGPCDRGLGASGLCFLPWIGFDSVNLGGMASGHPYHAPLVFWALVITIMCFRHNSRPSRLSLMILH